MNKAKPERKDTVDRELNFRELIAYQTTMNVIGDMRVGVPVQEMFRLATEECMQLCPYINGILAAIMKKLPNEQAEALAVELKYLDTAAEEGIQLSNLDQNKMPYNIVGIWEDIRNTKHDG